MPSLTIGDRAYYDGHGGAVVGVIVAEFMEHGLTGRVMARVVDMPSEMRDIEAGKWIAADKLRSTRTELVSERDREMAKDNAAKGFPWAVWMTHKRTGKLCFDASFETKERAERFAEEMRRTCRSHENPIVCFEG